MTAQQVKADYAPLPTRILRDPAFTALDLRVLGVIASYDRFNRNGKGCFASNATIGQRAGCTAKSAGRAIARLLEGGAMRDLNTSLGTQRSRRRLLVIVYAEDDLTGRELPRRGEFVATQHVTKSELPREPNKSFKENNKTENHSKFCAATNSPDTGVIREGAKAPKALDPSLSVNKPTEPKYTPPTAEARARVAEEAAECIRQLRFANAAPPPSRDELRAQLRADIGDQRFEAMPDALRANPVACAEPMPSSLRYVSRPAFEKMQRESPSLMHRALEGRRG